ncbi:putative Nucleoprotein TPR/MLP1 domain-containing protein [Seiridium cardinale]
MAAAGVDVGYLATHLGMPEENLATAATDPTVELVQAVLAAVAAKAHEYDALYSQKVQLEVELETNVRGAEAQRDASNERANKAQRDVEEIRQKLQQEETKSHALENELQSTKSSNSTSQSDVETLRAKVTSLESLNREKLAIIDTKNTANENLSQDLQALHQKNLKLNQELTTAQQTVQNVQGASNAFKITESRLRSELQMAERNAEFWEEEQKKKAAELNQVRKDKTSTISRLQSENQDLRSEKDSLEESVRQLRKQLEETQTKLAQAFQEKQQTIELAASREEGLRQDLDATKRLVNMREEQSNSLKHRLTEMDTRLEQVKRDGEDAVRRISEDLEQTRQAHDLAANEVENLQAEIARLEAVLAGSRASPSQPGSAPQTPRPMNGSLMGRPGSPFATPGSSIRKGMSVTQTLEEVYRLKGLLAKEKKHNEHLAKEIEEMMDQLEAKGPEIEELQADNQRLQEELQTMSHLSDESFQERDLAKKAARKAEAELKNAQTEINIARQQVRDLSAQIQMMIFNLQHQGQELSLEEELQVQRLQRGNATDDMSDVDALISERLVVFRDIKDLQEKNQDLLKVIHQLSEDMKNAEDAEAKQQAAKDHEEVIRLRDTIKEWEDRLRSMLVQHEAVVKQRDMFRRLAESRGSHVDGSTIEGGNGILGSIEDNGASILGDGTDYATVLRELQQQYDSHRAEWNTDRDTMKRQIDTLSSERNSLQAENAKVHSQLGLKDSRFEMLESNFKSLKSENESLSKRIREQSENLSKQDIRTQQAAEDLVEARSQVEGLRNENANLKAEKKLSKDIQNRLSQDNENLIQERSRLNEVVATQQRLQNERDIGEAETKRRLQTQVESLEDELKTVKRTLSDQGEETKQLQLRKEFDGQQYQKRIDELTSNLSQIREDLAATKTTKEHLQVRVDELTIELRTAEERAERLQPRPTPRPGSMAPDAGQTTSQDSVERIQELIHEVTDLKRDLELAKTHLENAEAQAAQYKELSQSNEEELQSLQAAQDQYVQEMDSALATKDASIKELEQRVEDMSAELARTNNELSTLRDSQEEVARRFQDEKSVLEEEVKRLKDQEENYTASAQFHQQDLRTQAEIASNAQQQYEEEVAKHGQTAANLHAIRNEYNQLRTSAATLRAEAESAKATLLQNESSWEERRKKLEQEMSDLRGRRDDADKQNKILHASLESMQNEVAKLQQTRASADASMEALSVQPTSSSEAGLREMANYLRREKDILEVQFDLKVREAKQLQQTLGYTQSQLDDAKLKLEQERQSQSSSEKSAGSHKDLMEKIEQLNLFRESSAALRAEKRQLEAQLTEKSAKVAEYEERIQPLEAQIEELNSQLEHKQAEIDQIRTDRDYWQKRSEDIIAKHGRTDPAEVEELKETIATLEAERNTLREAEQPLKDKVQELETALQEKETGWQTTREKLVAQFKERSRTLTAAKNEAIVEKDRLQGELNDANAQLTTAREDAESERNKYSTAEEQIRSFQSQVEALQHEIQQNSSATTQPATSTPAPAELPASADTSNSEQVANLEQQLAEVRTELDSITSQKATVDQDLVELRTQLDSVSRERDQALARTQPGAAHGDIEMENGTSGDAAATQPASASLTDEERLSLQQKITEAEAKAAEFEAKAKELEDNQTAIISTRSEKMKKALNDKLKAKTAEIEKERAELMESMKKQQAEINLRMEQERKIWEAEQKSVAPTASKPPATPSKAESATPASAPAPSTPSLDNISDDEARRFVANNGTVKGIITANVKSKIEQATKKLKEECEQNHVSKSEVEQKITQAKESAAKMASAKASVQINMAQNNAKNAQAKIAVVETAAKETPTKPVGEVWEIAKMAKPPPAQPKQPVPATGTNAAAPSARPVAANAGASQVPQAATGSALPKPPSSIPAPATTANGAANPTTAPVNPFAQSQNGQPPAASNPFASANNSQPGPQPTQPQPTQGAPNPQTGGQPKSGIPAPSNLPKSNIRAPSGTYQAPRGGRGGRGGGRGGTQAGGRTSLNPGVGDFQPGAGNKRPRNDSEAGGPGGQKRMRGGAGANAAQQ